MQKRFIDITGQTFGNLTVLRRVENKITQGKKRGSTKAQFLCKCICGEEVTRSSSNLKSKRTFPTCSKFCVAKLKYSHVKIGDKFNKFTIASGMIRHRGQVAFQAICECNTEFKVVANNLEKREGCMNCSCIKGTKEYFSTKRVANNKLPDGEANFNNIYSRYQYRAITANLDFELSKDQFRKITSSNCSYCGVEPYKITVTQKRGFTPYIYNGVDRIDSSKGYTIENCSPCCSECNYMKQESTLEQFKEQIQKIYKNLFKA